MADDELGTGSDANVESGMNCREGVADTDMVLSIEVVDENEGLGMSSEEVIVCIES